MGCLPRIEGGFQQRQIRRALPGRRRWSGDEVVVRVDKFPRRAPRRPSEDRPRRRAPPGSRAFGGSVQNPFGGGMGATMDRLATVAAGDGNLMPPILEAVRAYATVGEISDRLRVALGRAPRAHHRLRRPDAIITSPAPSSAASARSTTSRSSCAHSTTLPVGYSAACSG